jgi:hypothetical protein
MENAHYNGPFRTALLQSTNMGSWEPADSIAWWSDGTSNQLVIGEKYIPSGFLDTCDNTAGNVDGPGGRGNYGDCSILVAGSLNGYAVKRSFRAGMARDPNDTRNNTDDTLNPPRPHWGSNHPGVVNFLIGDGAVRTISVTIPTGNDSLFHRLGQVNDGNAVSIP